MPRKGLKRLLACNELPNVISKSSDLAGRWKENYFHRDGRLIVELGCGRAEITLAFARRYKKLNCVGVDKRGKELFFGAKQALEEGLSNAVFIRSRVEDIADFFDKEEIDEIWIPFPEPHPKRSKENSRLLSPRFLKLYRHVLKPSGKVHCKTDDEAFFRYVLNTLKKESCVIERCFFDLYALLPQEFPLGVQTKYEKRHLQAGKTIKYLRFCFAKG